MACTRVTRVIAEGVPNSHLHGETCSLFLSAHVFFPFCGFQPVLKTRAVQEACQATPPTPHTPHPTRRQWKSATREDSAQELIITPKVNTTAFCYRNNEITSTFVPDESGHATVEVLLNKLRKILQFTL